MKAVALQGISLYVGEMEGVSLLGLIAQLCAVVSPMPGLPSCIGRQNSATVIGYFSIVGARLVLSCCLVFIIQQNKHNNL
jgi:hypothetical protein